MNTQLRIRQLMEERGWTDCRLAKEANLSHSTYSGTTFDTIETGKKKSPNIYSDCAFWIFAPDFGQNLEKKYGNAHPSKKRIVLNENQADG